MNTNLALLLLLAPSRILFNIFLKVVGKPLLEFLGLLWLLFRLVLHYTFLDK
jgi:hypothetical protein